MPLSGVISSGIVTQKLSLTCQYWEKVIGNFKKSWSSALPRVRAIWEHDQWQLSPKLPWLRMPWSLRMSRIWVSICFWPETIPKQFNLGSGQSLARSSFWPRINASKLLTPIFHTSLYVKFNPTYQPAPWRQRWPISKDRALIRYDQAPPKNRVSDIVRNPSRSRVLDFIGYPSYRHILWGSFTVKLEAGGPRLRQSCSLTHR